VKEDLVCALEEIEETEKLENYLKKKQNHRLRPHFVRKHRSRIQRFGIIQKKPFSDLFVDYHNNVTILYADIVNFTPLTVKLKADELVATLNELFGRFDDAAQTRNCLRIKLIGDCYYCVSGLPTPTPDHARNCVELGFDMIEIIRDIRYQHSTHKIP
jgi:class 3 adenylate cyclase